MGAARKQRLVKAREHFDRVVEMYKTTPPKGDLEKLYQRLAHFYRADYVYDLGNYAESIRLYNLAAFRYQDDPSALAAYIQIVNAYSRWGRSTKPRRRTNAPNGCCEKCRPKHLQTAGSPCRRITGRSGCSGRAVRDCGNEGDLRIANCNLQMKDGKFRPVF